MGAEADPKKVAEWTRRLRRFEARSSQSVAVFCQNEGVSVPSLYKWRKRLQGSPFQAVQVAPAELGRGHEEAIIHLGQDIRIELGSDLTVVDLVLKRLLAVALEPRDESC